MQDGAQNPVTPFDIQSEADFDAVPRQFSPPPLDIGDPNDQDRMDAIHQWMLEALPAWSHHEQWDQRARMRAEPFRQTTSE